MNTISRIHAVRGYLMAMKYISPVFIAGLLLLTNHSMAEALTPAGLELKVASFNIRYLTTRDKGVNHWKARQARTVAAIRHLDADVLCLQEAFLSQTHDMEPSLAEYQRVGVGRDDGVESGETCSILFLKDRFSLVEHGTFWLSNTPEIAGSKHWGNEVIRICTWVLLKEKSSERSFYVFNSHFDHVSQDSKEQSARLIARRIADRAQSDAPFIMTGDLNATEDNPAIRYLKGEAVTLAGGQGQETTPVRMRDSFRVLNPEVTQVRTGHGFSGRTEGGKIDYVLIPKGVRVEAAAIDHFQQEGLFPSDHFPVTATIVIP